MTDTTDEPAVDPLLVDSAHRLFADTCTFDTVQAAEADGWAPDVWQAVADAGFAWIGLPETAGGSGGTVADACAVVRAAGAHAAPVPLAETALLGGWLLTEAGLDLPDGPVTVAPGTVDDRLTVERRDDGSVELDGEIHRVPWAARSDRIALVVEAGDERLVVAAQASDATVAPTVNLAGEPRETVRFDRVAVPPERVASAGSAVSPERLRLRGALSRVMLMAGALEAMSRLTIDYTEQRQQFGRPVGRFQAVQQHLVWGAQDAALTAMAAEVAARQATRDLDHARFEIAAARTVADDAAGSATRWAHQAHGAMGMTQEYALHHLSRRLWAWRHEWSRPGEWSFAVGGMAVEAGADGLYPLIAR